MKGIIFPVCAAALWVTVLFRLRDLVRRWPDASSIALCAALALAGVSFTVSVPAVSAAIDATTGFANLGAFVIHACTVSYSFTTLALLEFWANPLHRALPRARRRLIALAVVLVALATLFLVAGVEHRSPHYLLQNTGDPIVAGYGLLYIGALSVGVVAAVVLCWRYAKLVRRPWLRRGLRLTAVGNGLTLGYCATRFGQIVGAQVGASPAPWEALVPLFAGLGSLVGLAGLTMPNWGPRLTALRRWSGQYRAYRRLYPLWSALHRAVPEIALEPPGSGVADRLAVRDLNLRLCRRVIEIRDAQLSLQPWLDPRHADLALRAGRGTGLADADLRAAVEAFQLRCALLARLHTAGVADRAGVDPPLSGAAELQPEIAWLERVARFFVSSPLPIRPDEAVNTAPPSAPASSPGVRSGE